MASVYVTKRGKNKKGKLGIRKDASNNAANKLNTKMAELPVDYIPEQKNYGKQLALGSSSSRQQSAIESARSKLKLLLTNVCGNKDCSAKKEQGVKLLLCQGCRSRSYCSPECQKADWPLHKAACHEAQAKKKEELQLALAALQTLNVGSDRPAV